MDDFSCRRSTAEAQMAIKAVSTFGPRDMDNKSSGSKG